MRFNFYLTVEPALTSGKFLIKEGPLLPRTLHRRRVHRRYLVLET